MLSVIEAHTLLLAKICCYAAALPIVVGAITKSQSTAFAEEPHNHSGRHH